MFNVNVKCGIMGRCLAWFFESHLYLAHLGSVIVTVLNVMGFFIYLLVNDPQKTISITACNDIHQTGVPPILFEGSGNCSSLDDKLQNTYKTPYCVQKKTRRVPGFSKHFSVFYMLLKLDRFRLDFHYHHLFLIFRSGTSN